ncbi:MAG: transposase [Gammaproteobacteria bacterium]|jgi:hypothetical protein
MDDTAYLAWYDKMMPADRAPEDTAANLVGASFDFSDLYDLESAFQRASRDMDRRARRVALLTEKHGWDLESGVRVMCPLHLQAILSALPEDEPLEPAGVGGAPAVPFRALLRAFLFAPFFEVEDNAAALWRALANNPTFLRRCGFPDHDLPSERTLQRFNAVMNESGLWGEARRRLVRKNYATGALRPPRRLAIDPGHEDGYAGVRRPCAACRSCGGCPKEHQVRTCDVTDIVAKRATYQFPGVKGVFVTDIDAEMPMVVVAVNAREFDGNVGVDAALAVAMEYPDQVATVKEASLDGAYDAADQKQGISEALGGADVLVPINVRGRKSRPVKGARGIDHIEPNGVPHCIAGLSMKYLGRDEVRQEYRWGCPKFDRASGTLACPKQGSCCPNPGKTGRQYRVPRASTPQIDWKNPQHSEDFKERYKGRTAVERTIARTKRSFPFERHWGRGRAAFQGHLDKGVLAFHVLLSAADAADRREVRRRPLTLHQRHRDAA